MSYHGSRHWFNVEQVVFCVIISQANDLERGDQLYRISEELDFRTRGVFHFSSHNNKLNDGGAQRIHLNLFYLPMNDANADTSGWRSVIFANTSILKIKRTSQENVFDDVTNFHLGEG